MTPNQLWEMGNIQHAVAEPEFENTEELYLQHLDWEDCGLPYDSQHGVIVPTADSLLSPEELAGLQAAIDPTQQRDAVIIGDSIVRHVHATLGKSKVQSHCFPGARVSEIAARVPEILNGDERVGTVVLHAGVNDIRLRQTEILKKDFRNLIDTVRSTTPETTIIVSGPLPTRRALRVRGVQSLHSCPDVGPQEESTEGARSSVSSLLS
ncbi:unnamed protein product [Leuciscus chuanchicus]